MILLKTCLDIMMGIFEYILGISKEASFYVGRVGVYFRACVNCVVLFMLNVCGRGFIWLIFCK
jgi:hypothetical protein